MEVLKGPNKGKESGKTKNQKIKKDSSKLMKDIEKAETIADLKQVLIEIVEVI